MLSGITCTTRNQSETEVTDNNDIDKTSSVSPNVASTTVTRESPTIASDIVTSIEPKSSESDNNNAIPLIAGVIAGIIVLIIIGSGIVLVVVLMKARHVLDKTKVANPCVTNYYFNIYSFRKWKKLMNNSYDIVNDLVNEKPVQAIEMFPNLSENKSSSLPLYPTIEDIHDCSENEEDTPDITSMANILYEPGRCTKFNLL